MRSTEGRPGKRRARPDEKPRDNGGEDSKSHRRLLESLLRTASAQARIASGRCDLVRSDDAKAMDLARESRLWAQVGAMISDDRLLSAVLRQRPTTHGTRCRGAPSAAAAWRPGHRRRRRLEHRPDHIHIGGSRLYFPAPTATKVDLDEGEANPDDQRHGCLAAGLGGALRGAGEGDPADWLTRASR